MSEELFKSRVFNVMEEIKELLIEVEDNYTDFTDVMERVLDSENNEEFDVGYYVGLTTALDLLKRNFESGE